MKRLNLSGGVAASVLMAGCSAFVQPETNQEACVRAMTHFFFCFDESVEDPEAAEALEAFVDMACEGLPEGPECDWPTLADCVTMHSCDEMMVAESFTDEACSEIISDFEENECSAPSLGALKAIEQ